MNKYIVLLALFVITVSVGITAFAIPHEHVESSSVSQSEPKGEGLAEAEFSFQVTDIQRKGNVVSFTIPKDAHAMEERADAVVVSGMYADSKSGHADCPMVSSAEVDDQLEDYDPFSGKARVNAVFEDESMAAEAADKGCLLVKDVD